MESTFRHNPLAGPRKEKNSRDGGGWRAFLGLDEQPSEEVRRGQILLVIARWVLIGVGLFLTLNEPENLVQLQVGIVGLLAMAVVNFSLHMNLVMKKPASQQTLYLASIGDVVLISAIVAIAGGFDSYTFVFYYTAAVGYSLVFPLRRTIYLTAAMIGLYVFVVFGVSGDLLETNQEAALSTLLTRTITLVAVATIASLYRSVDRQRVENVAQSSSV